MKQQEIIKKEWQELMDSGKMPIIEQYETGDDKNHTVKFVLDDFGVGMEWEFLDSDAYENVEPYFDGFLVYRDGLYYLPFSEIETMEYHLHDILELLYANFSEGLLYTI